jgi:preprotein translocase subunit SecF
MRATLSRLYHSETNFGFITHRKWWYTISIIAMLISGLSIGIRGFNLGVDFKGGNSLTMPTGKATLDQVNTATGDSGIPTESIQKVGTGGTAQFVIKTRVLPDPDIAKLKSTIVSELGDEISVKGRALRSTDISQSQISASWGRDISRKAITALVVFLIAVSAFISLMFEWRLAVGAIIGVLHDLVLAAGIYSLVGFEVTPSTVVGLLTILGYSLYDNIVVYDKIRENVRGILGLNRETYSEAANRAVNETLARSINTSLISVLPVAGLLFVGAGLLGIGTIKDLALVLFVGLISGAYSSLFLAVPLGTELKERQPEYIALRARVAARRAKHPEEERGFVPVGTAGTADTDSGTGQVAKAVPAVAGPAVDAPAVPRPGARPARPNRPAQRPNQRKRKPQARRKR